MPVFEGLNEEDEGFAGFEAWCSAFAWVWSPFVEAALSRLHGGLRFARGMREHHHGAYAYGPSPWHEGIITTATFVGIAVLRDAYCLVFFPALAAKWQP